MNIESIPVPDKFPPGCEFVSMHDGGNDRVAFPDGKVLILSDDGATLEPIASLPRRDKSADSTEASFLSAAKSYRDWAANINLEKKRNLI